jgi:hypothetical protein
MMTSEVIKVIILVKLKQLNPNAYCCYITQAAYQFKAV